MKKFKNIENLIPVLAFVLSYILLFSALFLTFRFSAFNPTIYYFIFGFIFILILLFGVVSYEGIIENKKKLRMTGTIVLGLLSLLLVLGVYYVVRVNSSINNVIVDPNQSTKIETSFVVYNSNNLSSIKDFSGKKLGVLSNSENADRNSHVKSEIERLSLNIKYIEYLSYNEMLLGLFGGEIDVAALPSDYVNQFSDYEGYSEYLEKTKIIESFKTEIENTSEEVNIDVTSEPFSLLIMGNDGGRTDSLILATFNPINLHVTMTSVPRDSYVPIACYPNQQKDKIGHAFSVSRDCAIETVENLFDIDINYYVEVNFKGVVEVVDALDKIWITSPVEFVGQNSDDERGHYTVKIFKGGQWVTGEQALAFARERHHMPGGDYQRQENQQGVIRSILQRTLELRDINKAINVLDAAGNNIKTNMKLDQMIALFNKLMKVTDKTGLEPAASLDIDGSRVIGYSSYTYNESLQLPLWILRPYEGSISDLKNFMASNLKKDSSTPDSLRAYFDSIQVLYREDYFAKTYNEKEIHEVLPDFMPTMANNNWTLEQARVWASKRNITLAVEEIKPGNASYTENVVHNYIVGQNVKYGVKTSSFTSLSIKVIKHNLNCKLDENKQYEECKYKLPDWQDYGAELTTISSALSWFKDLGLNPTIKYINIPETDPTYKKEKVGYIIKQNPTEWADVRTLNEITFTVMDPNYSIVIPDTATWTETIARKWVKDNLELETNIEVTYVPTLDLNLVGKVVTTKPEKNSSIKYQKDILKISVYAEGYTLTSQVGKTQADVQSSLCNTIILCKFVDKPKSSATEVVGQIASHDFVGVLKTKQEWLITTVAFEVITEVTTITP